LRRTSGSPPVRADLADAQADEHARETRDLLEAEDVFVPQKAIARVEHLARHAVHAAKVAAIGHRDAQVVHRPAARVGQRSTVEDRGRDARRRGGRVECNNLFHQGFWLGNPL
jgi:hypothetical protein